MGKIVSDNMAKWDQPAKATAFLTKLKEYLADVTKNATPFVGPNGEQLDEEDVRTLSEAVELLMLFSEAQQ